VAEVPDWRIGDGQAPVAPDGVTELSGPRWRGRFERMAFGAGFHMHLGRVETCGPAVIPVIRGDPGPGPVSAFTLASGRAAVSVTGTTPIPLEPGRAILLTVGAGGAAFQVPAGQVLRFLGVAMSPALMVELLDGRIPEGLVRLIAGRGCETVVKERAVAAATRTLVEELGEPGDGGALQRLHREAVAVRLVAEMIGAELSDRDEGAPPRDVAAVRAARERLLADLHDAPSAAMLAEAAGLSLRRFLRAFEAVHGASPAQLLRQERLAEARRLLEAGDLPLKAIAWQVGYGHVSNFVAAFAEQYGAPPRRFSRRGLAAE